MSLNKRLLVPAAVGLSFASTAFLPWVSQSPLGDLSGIHSDHRRHVYAVRVFAAQGIAIWRDTFGEAASGVAYPYAIVAWPQVPYAYPPGALALYAPMTLLGQFLRVSDQDFSRLCILYLLIVAHLSLWAIFRTLEQLPPGARSLVALAAWLIVIRAALQGFFDPAWLGCGAMMVLSVRRQRFGNSLMWFAGAALLHYRAVVLAPLAAYALIGWWRSQRPDWRRPEWYVLGFVGAVNIGTFLLVSRHSGAFREVPPLYAQSAGAPFWLAVAFSILAIGWCAQFVDWATAGAVALCLALALVDTHVWWHASILFVPCLAAGAAGQRRLLAVSRSLLLVWLVQMQRLAWGGRIWDVFAEIRHALQL